MHTLYLWRCTSPINGRRYTTRHHLSEADARRTLIDPERIDDGAIEVKPVTVAPSGTWVSGLVMREDGAMVYPPDR